MFQRSDTKTFVCLISLDCTSVPGGPFLEVLENLPGAKSVLGDKCFSTEVNNISFKC